VTVKNVGPQKPNQNALAVRFVQSIGQEGLDHFIVFGEDHLRLLSAEFLGHYPEFRPHQGAGNRPLTGGEPPEWTGPVAPDAIVCEERLGGLLRHYARRAA
jgi:putative transposase